MHLIIFRKMLETTFRFWDSAGKAHPSTSPPSMAMKIQWVREMLRRNRVMLIGASADPGPGNKGGAEGGTGCLVSFQTMARQMATAAIAPAASAAKPARIACRVRRMPMEPK